MMNILIINGSPRKKGLISQMLDIMREDAERLRVGDGTSGMERGNQVQTVYTNDLSIKPCIGCMACRTKEKCVLGEDDSQRVLKMMQEADAIIMGAPCYWGNIPGQMKLLFDRIVYGMMRDTPRFPEPLMKGKKCILLSTCTTPWPWNIWFKQSRGAIRAMREICRYSGFKIVATIERGGTAMHPELSEKDKQKCHKAIGKLTK
jgi:Multimeric flavodoxin WrbA